MKKRADNDYVLNKVEYPRTDTEVHILLLSYQTDYNYNRQYQYQGVINQLMFIQRGKTGDDECETKYDRQKPRRNLYQITCNGCG